MRRAAQLGLPGWLLWSKAAAQPPAAPPAPPPVSPGLPPAAPAAPGTPAPPLAPPGTGATPTVGLGTAAGLTLAGVAVGLGVALLLRWILRRWWDDDVECWTEICTLVRQPPPPTTVPGDSGPGTTGVGTLDNLCWYNCVSPFGVKLDWLAEHDYMSGKPCPSKIEIVWCRYKGVTNKASVKLTP